MTDLLAVAASRGWRVEGGEVICRRGRLTAWGARVAAHSEDLAVLAELRTVPGAVVAGDVVLFRLPSLDIVAGLLEVKR